MDNWEKPIGRQTSSGNVKGSDGAFPLDLQTLRVLYPYTLQYPKGYEYASNLPSGSCGEPVLRGYSLAVERSFRLNLNYAKNA